MADIESSKGASNSTFTYKMQTELHVRFAKIASDITIDERLIAAAREDNEEMLLEVFEEGGYDINYQDG